MPSAHRGSAEITEIYSGSTPVLEVYSGSTLAWAANHRLTQGRSYQTTVIGYSDVRGFDISGQTSPSIGSLAPSKLNGATIKQITCFEINIASQYYYTFAVVLDGIRSQNFFTSVYESSLGTKTTSSASSFVSADGVTTWLWNITGFPNNWDGSSLLELDFV